MTFRALRVTVDSTSPYVSHAELASLDDAALGDDGVAVEVDYSSINYKDGLALTGRPGVIRSGSVIAGIDLVGRLASGERVLVNGCGLGESRDGGLSERAVVNPEWLVRVPDAISSERAAAIGTAGFTAMLAVLAIERSGSRGEVLVTGASGGVGSVAVALLARLGYTVAASTGKRDEHDYLRSLGAAEVIDRAELSASVGAPLQHKRWAGVVDSLGGATLANVLAQTEYGGVVTSCGLAQDAALPTTVLPFILRAVSLVGINSVECPMPERELAWSRLATDLDLDLLDSMTTTVPLESAVAVAERIVRGEVRGRTVVDVQN
jgi:acrylyl-CoA reductase (NADPH)